VPDPHAHPHSHPHPHPLNYRGDFGGHPFWGHPQHHARHHGSPEEPTWDPQAFFRNIGSQLGLNVDEFLNPNANAGANNSEVDFVPRADVFDATTKYLVHVSLPGAQKPDLSVDYDAENSVLRLAGVVYRPGIDEELNKTLVVEGRAREVGVFEREVRLGTRRSPADVQVDKISAKLADGVLVVVLPKVIVDPEKLRRRVSVEQVVDEGEAKLASENQDVHEYHAMHVESETEKGDGQEDDAINEDDDDEDHYSEDEEREYVTVDVK
jgi:HSP20 family protein